jgi:hypothetical protein
VIDIITAKGDSYGMLNTGTFNTADGNDVITGTGGKAPGIIITYGSTFDTETATTQSVVRVVYGASSNTSFTFNTGDGNDTIEGLGGHYGIENTGLINTGNGKDTIIAKGRVLNSGSFGMVSPTFPPSILVMVTT